MVNNFTILAMLTRISHLKSLNTKNPRHFPMDISVMAWDMNKNEARLNR